MFGLLDEKSKLAKARRKTVERFRKALLAPSGFEIAQVGDDTLLCSSSTCAFEFAFERRESDTYVSHVYDPNRPEDRMHLYLLRLMFGAKGDGRTSPEATAAALSRHFPLLLDGDFSIHDAYRRLESEVLDGLEAARRPGTSNLIRKKVADFDPGFLLDLRRSATR